MSSSPSVVVEGLSKAYPIYARNEDRLLQLLLGWRRDYYTPFWALRDINLEIRRGETIGLIGRNGSGKSTLLQILAGTLEPSSGSATVHGRVAALLELGAGFNPEFTGRENVFLSAAIAGLTQAETEARFDGIAAFADIGAFMEQPVKRLSSGMFMRLAFAVHAHVDADVLIVDEALAVGDLEFQIKCFAYLRQLRERGTTIILVSHDLAAVRSFCERAVYLRHGELIAVGPCADVVRQYEYEVLQRKTAPKGVSANTGTVDVPANELDPTNSRVLLDVFAQQKPEFERLAARQQRLGSGSARIVGFVLADASVSPLQTIDPTEEVLGCFLIRFERPHQGEVHLSIAIHDKCGASVMVVRDSYFSQLISAQAEDVCVASLRFRLPLKAGDYYATIGVYLFEEGEKYKSGEFNFDAAELADLITEGAHFRVLAWRRHAIPAPVLNEARLKFSVLSR